MRVLIVGLGSIAKKHIAALYQIDPSVELFALRSNKEAKSWNGITSLYDWNELNAYQFDFAIISNPTSEHIPAIRQLLPHRIPLFIEKPLQSEIVQDCLISEVKEAGIITYIGCNLRFHECLLQVPSLITNHRVNEVNAYCGSYLPDWRPQVDYHTVYSANPEMGGGVHLDLIHELDYIYWLFGYPEGMRKIFSHKSSLEICACDYANYLLEYPQYNINIILNYYRRDYKRTLEIVCEDATYNIDLANNTIAVNGKLIFSSDKRIIDTYFPQMKYFIDCVQNHQHSFNSIEDANNVLKICFGYDTER